MAYPAESHRHKIVAMGRVTDHIDEPTSAWIERQHLFFVATAPSMGGHVNLSPKGLDSFRILSPTEAAYLDLTGSGAETIAHVRDNGRITVMFSAFEGPPRIVRVFGEGSVHEAGTRRFEELAPGFPTYRAARSIITIAVDRVQDSCGYGVPEMQFVGERSQLVRWADNRSDEELASYRMEKNAVSIDGLPALEG